MQAASYNPIRARNVAQEMANHALERGEGLTRDDYRGLGYSDEQIDRHSNDAAVIYAKSLIRAA